jgi:hypothetical protein
MAERVSLFTRGTQITSHKERVLGHMHGTGSPS